MFSIGDKDKDCDLLGKINEGSRFTRRVPLSIKIFDINVKKTVNLQ